MISSYRLSEQYNFQSLLWDVAGAVASVVRLVVMVAGWLAVASRWLLAGGRVLLPALGLVALIAVVVVAMAMVPVTFWLGLGITAVLAYVGYPRGK